MTFTTRASLAVFRWIGVLLPRSSRRELMTLAESDLQHRLELASERGHLATLRVGIAATLDVLTQLPGEWHRHRRLNRQGWWDGMMDRMKALRLALRGLTRRPGFTVVAVLTLALGIGANTAIFSVVNGVLLEPLPFDDPDELIGVWHTAPGLNFEQVNMSPANYLTYREHARFFEGIGMWDNRSASVTGVGDPEQVRNMVVTHELLPLLGVQPHVGRLFTEEDDSVGAPLTVMLGFPFWQRTFAGDRGAIGQTLTVNGETREIIGVLPRDFELPGGNAALYVPLQIDPAQVFLGNFDYQAVARLSPGATLEQVNDDLTQLTMRAAELYPGGISIQNLEEARWAGRVNRLKEDYVGDIGNVLWVLLGTVGMVLLIACANVANLFLVHAEGRQREVAVRTAMGASRGTVARQFLLESTTLGVLGGLMGLAMAYGGLELLVRIAENELPRIQEIGISLPVLGYTFALSIFAGAFFGAFPVLKLRGLQLVSSLKEGGRGAGAGKERHRARNALVIGQVALALVLLVGSGLMIRSFQALRDVHPGFERPAEVQTFRLNVPPAEMGAAELAVAYRNVVEQLETLPGVISVGASFSLTMDGWDSNDAVYVEDFPVDPGTIPPIRRLKWITPGYHQTMENPILAGRSIEWSDIDDRRQSVVVTRNFAELYWGSPSEAIGGRVGLGAAQVQDIAWFEIVGVVGDVRDNGVDQPAEPVLFFPYAGRVYWEADPNVPFTRRQMAFAVRTDLPDPGSLMPRIRETVWSITPTTPLAAVQTMQDVLDGSLARTSFALILLGIAAGVALLLGTVGIYGVISYVVSQRTREIGVRMALGAERGHVSGMVVRQGMTVVLAGVVVGLAAAFGLTRLMSALLFGVEATDPLTFVSVAGVLTAVALLASYLPAARAARVDPVEALRAE